MKHEPVVRDVQARPPTYPEGHWMNRFWPTLARGVAATLGRWPIFRYVPRVHPAAAEFLERGAPALFVCTHQDILDTFMGLPRVLRGRPFAAMASHSRDGDLAAMGLAMLGYRVVRGSSSRGGGQGLLLLRATLQSGCSALLACDGPRAPLGDVKAGSVKLAANAGVPIVPVRSWGLARMFTLERSWTKAVVSVPFLPVAVCIGEPVRVRERNPEPRPYQLRIARSLARMAAWAGAWAGGPRRAPFRVAER